VVIMIKSVNIWVIYLANDLSLLILI